MLVALDAIARYRAISDADGSKQAGEGRFHAARIHCALCNVLRFGKNYTLPWLDMALPCPLHTRDAPLLAE